MRIAIHIVVIEKQTDIRAYNYAQIAEALKSEQNHHGARVANHCDDAYLAQHPDLLMKHFSDVTEPEGGGKGAEWAAKQLRPRFQKEVEIPLHRYLQQQFGRAFERLKKVPRKEFVRPKRVFRRISFMLMRFGMTRPINHAVFHASRLAS